ncbi:MAG: PEP-CTERM sorting domain-containing protein [Pseudomonadota bacterium]
MHAVRPLLAVIATTALTATAHAGPIFEYESASGNPFGGGSGGAYDSIRLSYDSMTEDFTFAVDYDGAVAEGGWLVVSDGPNPKRADDELAILYFDQGTQDVWAYAYNGRNNNASWQTTQFLGFFADAYTTSGDISTLALNAASINSQLAGTGVAFGPLIGIWFHPSFNQWIEGDAAGIHAYVARRNGWYDTHNDGRRCQPRPGHGGCVTTTEVPEPGALVLLATGLGALAMRRRRQR